MSFTLMQEETDTVKGSLDKGHTPLPILCIEDGMEILRFSEIFSIHEPLKKGEIFSIHEPLKKGEKRDHRYSILKGMLSCFRYFLSGLMFPFSLSFYLFWQFHGNF
jgi:hypothetical protein